MGGKVLADIPGLIEGAWQGKGLGIKFLKHIEKVNLLLHCISVESEDVQSDYRVVRQELDKYSKELMEKPEIILLTKSDLSTKKDLQTKQKILQKYAKVHTVSILDDQSLKSLERILIKI